jgi:hypothetical protein
MALFLQGFQNNFLVELNQFILLFKDYRDFIIVVYIILIKFWLGPKSIT